MKKCALVIGLGILLTVACFSQQTSWTTQHHDSLLLAPYATQVKYVEWADFDHVLTYVVEEPYPADAVLGPIREDLKQKGWKQVPPGSQGSNTWLKMDLPPSRPQYQWMGSWADKNNDRVSYVFRYTDTVGENYLQTLHIEAVYSAGKPISAQEQLNGVAIRVGMATLGSLLLFGTPLILGFTRARSVVFYGGPNAWLTIMNLVFFGPIAGAILWFGALLISESLGKVEPALVVAIAGAVVLMLIFKAGYVVCAVVVLLLLGIISINNLPTSVRIAHCALCLASILFFALCAHYGSGRLIQW